MCLDSSAGQFLRHNAPVHLLEIMLAVLRLVTPAVDREARKFAMAQRCCCSESLRRVVRVGKVAAAVSRGRGRGHLLGLLLLLNAEIVFDSAGVKYVGDAECCVQL